MCQNPFKDVPDRRKLFSREDPTILRNLVRERVDWYLDELVYEMECLTGKRASITSLWAHFIIWELLEKR